MIVEALGRPSSGSIRTMPVTIRRMTIEDVPPATDVVRTGEWGDRGEWFAFAASHPECIPFVAELDGAMVGTAVATVNGNAGWVGTVFVAAIARGRGIGGALTDATIEALEAAGCRTLVLVATDEGRPIYERRGFVVDTSYLILASTGTVRGAGASPLRPFRGDDLEPMVALDRLATGEDRGHLLRAFASESSARCLPGDDGRPRGFVVRAPWGGAATVAPEREDGLAILEARRAIATPDKVIRAGVLAENAEAIDHLRASGWLETRNAPRLVRGEPLDWRPRWIWGQFNFGLG
jgi:GNAT superfamily N-acetyltransferase